MRLSFLKLLLYFNHPPICYRLQCIQRKNEQDINEEDKCISKLQIFAFDIKYVEGQEAKRTFNNQDINEEDTCIGKLQRFSFDIKYVEVQKAKRTFNNLNNLK
jgi:hypothetical protein